MVGFHLAGYRLQIEIAQIEDGCVFGRRLLLLYSTTKLARVLMCLRKMVGVAAGAQRSEYRPILISVVTGRPQLFQAKPASKIRIFCTQFFREKFPEPAIFFLELDELRKFVIDWRCCFRSRGKSLLPLVIGLVGNAGFLASIFQCIAATDQVVDPADPFCLLLVVKPANLKLLLPQILTDASRFATTRSYPTALRKPLRSPLSRSRWEGFASHLQPLICLS